MFGYVTCDVLKTCEMLSLAVDVKHVCFLYNYTNNIHIDIDLALYLHGQCSLLVDNNRMFYSIMENESLIHDTTRSGVE